MTQSNHTLGISCAISGMAAMSVMDAIIKWLSDGYPLHEIVLARTLVAIILTVLMVHLEGGLHLLRTKRIGLHSARGVLVAIANMSFYLSLSVMPIAQATGLFFIAPLLITGLSGPMLGEQVGWRRWVAIAVGFVGVLLISGVGTDLISPMAFLPLLAALAYALVQLLARKLGNTDKASVMSFYISVVFLIISTAFFSFAGDGRFLGTGGDNLSFLFRPWVMPTTNHMVLMLVCGVLVACAGYLLNQAYRVSMANVIAPFEYIALPLAITWGWLFWDEIPNGRTLLGIALIGCAGLYVFVRERMITAQTSESV